MGALLPVCSSATGQVVLIQGVLDGTADWVVRLPQYIAINAQAEFPCIGYACCATLAYRATHSQTVVSGQRMQV